MASARASCSWVVAIRAAIAPSARATGIPPACSISWNAAQAACATCSVSDSTYQEPPAGSVTRAIFDSSARSNWVLRARRREIVRPSPVPPKTRVVDESAWVKG